MNPPPLAHRELSLLFHVPRLLPTYQRIGLIIMFRLSDLMYTSILLLFNFDLGPKRYFGWAYSKVKLEMYCLKGPDCATDVSNYFS